ncbi:hypothetical protein [Nocardia asteroides]|uniref:hypothetical protein n=1 Tax=Nocardia asteroides TaxID=1824 RepID=UPI0034126219
MTTEESPRVNSPEPQATPLHTPASGEAVHGGVVAGAGIQIDRGGKAVGRDDNSDHSRRTRISTGGITGIVIAAILTFGAGTAGVVAVAGDNGPPAPETVGTAQTTDGITEAVNAFTGAVAADDFHRACSFVAYTISVESLQECLEELEADNIWHSGDKDIVKGKGVTTLIKILDGKKFIANTKPNRATEAQAEYGAGIRFELVYFVGRWFIHNFEYE